MELTIRMETITSFDQILGVTSLGYFSLEDLPGWEIVVYEIEVFEFCAIGYYLLVHF